MRDVIIKYTALSLLVAVTGLFIYTNPRAMTFEEENLLIFPRKVGGPNGPGEANHQEPAKQRPAKKRVIKPLKLEKNKNGAFIAKWGILSEYDPKANKAGMNLKKIIGKKVEVSGFMMPLDYSAKNIKEFLLVPYMPSCNHVPPPPSNQIISVKVSGKQGVEALYYPVQMEGILTVTKAKPSNDPYMPTGIYEMTIKKIEKRKRRKRKKRKLKRLKNKS